MNSLWYRVELVIRTIEELEELDSRDERLQVEISSRYRQLAMMLDTDCRSVRSQGLDSVKQYVARMKRVWVMA